jgi:hypothetical protein
MGANRTPRRKAVRAADDPRHLDLAHRWAAVAFVFSGLNVSLCGWPWGQSESPAHGGTDDAGVKPIAGRFELGLARTARTPTKPLIMFWCPPRVPFWRRPRQAGMWGFSKRPPGAHIRPNDCADQRSAPFRPPQIHLEPLFAQSVEFASGPGLHGYRVIGHAGVARVLSGVKPHPGIY